jgi:hypothetical protein
MIRLNDHALLMRYPDGRVLPLDLSDLVHELAAQAAPEAVPIEPWMIENVVHSILHYIKNDLGKEVVTLQDFIDLSQDILARFAAPPQDGPVCDLFHLAQRAGPGFELRFYDMLRERITELAEKGADSYAFIGFRPCVKFLAGRRRWRVRCRTVSEELLRFIRETVLRLAPENARLSVTS